MIPPGKYISSRSRPTPEVSSRTSSLAPKMAGMPFTQSTPNSGPAIDPQPADDGNGDDVDRLVGVKQHLGGLLWARR